jgi:two-component system response regulator AtoC
VNVFAIRLPPLRDRVDDIPALVAHFIGKHGHRGESAGISAAALNRLSRYDWPGNVRELENMIERALILSGGQQLEDRHFALSEPASAAALQLPAPPRAVPLNAAVAELEARLIGTALAEAQGSKPRAAALVDISERTLWYKLKKYRLG